MTDILGTDDARRWLAEGLLEAGARDPEFVAEIATSGAEMLKHSLAENTKCNYRQAFERFERFCRKLQVPALPATPQTVVAYIICLVEEGSNAAAADRASESRPAEPPAQHLTERLAPGTIAAAVSAIGTTHRNHKYTDERDPTKHPRVRQLLGAYRRHSQHQVRQAHAFSIEELAQMCDRCLIPSHARERDLLLIALATHPGSDVNANRLQRLTWDMVELPADEGPACLHFGGRIGHIWIPTDPDESVCPVARLRRWQKSSAPTGPVFESPDKPGQPVTRQGIAARVRQLLASAGVPTDEVVGELPRLTAAQRRQVIDQLQAPTAIQIRDRAVMTTFWWLGLRAESITRLNVADLTFLPERDGLQYRISRSKTDPYGQGHTTGVARQSGAQIVCPVGAMQAWLHRYAQLLGHPHGPTTPLEELIELLAGQQLPLFPSLREVQPGPRLGYAGINDLTKRWAEAAGVEPIAGDRISSHGFRAGNTTSLINANVSAERIADHQGRIGNASVYTYLRRGDVLAHNATDHIAVPTPAGAGAVRPGQTPSADDHPSPGSTNGRR